MAKKKKQRRKGRGAAGKTAAKPGNAAPAAAREATSSKAAPKGGPPSEPPSGAASRESKARILGTIASLVGLGVAAYLVDHHNQVLYAGGEGSALCNASDVINCDKVNTSRFAKMFGVPIATYAIPAYVVSLLLLWWRSLEPRWTWLFGLGLACSAYSVFLGAISSFYVGAVCLFCMSLYAVNFSLLGLAWWASGRSLGENLRALLPETRGAIPQLGSVVALGVLVLGIAVATQASQKAAMIEATTAEQLAQMGLDGSSPAAASSTSPSSSAGPAAPAAAGPVAGAVVPADTPAGRVDLASLASEGESKTVRLIGNRVELDLPSFVPRKGPADAPVTIIEFADFECPFCKKLSHNLAEIHERYPDDVQVAFVHFPMHSRCNANELPRDMHPRACLAAQASFCAQEQGLFWEMHDALFQNQTRLQPRALARYARRIGADVGAWETCMRSPDSLAEIIRHSELGGLADIRGTPSMLVNGHRLSGAQPVEVLSAVIDAALEGREQTSFTAQVGVEQLGQPAQALPVREVDGPYGRFDIDTFEASLSNGAARSVSGVEVARGVSWHEASAACQAAGRRLCTQGEWIAACTSAVPVDRNNNGIFSDDWIEGTEFAYGSHYVSGLCADSRRRDDERPLVAGVHPRCVSGTGVHDMHGNVKEWVGISPDQAGVVGGSYFSGASARCTYWKDSIPPDTSDDTSLGFRCCSGPLPSELQANQYPGGRVGEQLMSFTGDGLLEGSFSSSSLEGRAVVLSFWASWCGPCRAELPVLEQLYQEYRSQGVEVIGINVDRDIEAGRRMAREMGLTFPLIADPTNELMGRFDTRGLPTAFWVDRSGSIRSRTVGFNADRGIEGIREHFEPLL